MTPPIDLERLRARDPKLLEELVRDVSPQLLAVIRGYARDGDHANDLLQDCWIQILERLESYRPRGTFVGWAVAVTRNVCKSSLRRARLTDQAEVGIDDLDGMPDPAPGHEEQRTQRRLRTALFKALGKLPDRERETIVLRVLEGRTTEETAEMQGISRAAVRDLEERGLYRIRRMRAVGTALEAWMDRLS